MWGPAGIPLIAQGVERRACMKNNSPTGFGRGVFISVLEECVATYKEDGHQDSSPVDIVTCILVF